MAPEHPHYLPSNSPKMSLLFPLLATHVIRLRPALDEVGCSLVDAGSAGGVTQELAEASSRELVLVEEVNKEDTAMIVVEVVVVPEGDGLDGRIMTSLKEIVTHPLISRQIGRCWKRLISTVWLS
jgi:hypothetical protein